MATPPTGNLPHRLFGRGSWAEARRIGDVLRTETVGGVLLLGAAVIAPAWANSPWRDAYTGLSGLRVGAAALGLDLSLATWAADELLAFFFFVAGLELKREFVAGDLRDVRRAALPVAAAVGGMDQYAPAVGAANLPADHGRGGRPAGHPGLAVFYTSTLHVLPLALALLPLGLFGLLVQRRVRAWWALLPPALLAWGLMHESGVHATVAGVLLAFTVPVVRRAQGPGPGLAEHFEHVWRPLSSGWRCRCSRSSPRGSRSAGWATAWRTP